MLPNEIEVRQKNTKKIRVNEAKQSYADERTKKKSIILSTERSMEEGRSK